MASAKANNLSPKSKFQQALENAQANNTKRFKFIDRKGRERYYEINNGIINETTNDTLSSLSPFESALNNAQKKGLTSFQFTDQKGKIRTYVISKNGTLNEKVSLDDKFSSQKRVVKKPLLPRAFKSTDQKLGIKQGSQITKVNKEKYSKEDIRQLAEVDSLELDLKKDKPAGPSRKIKKDEYQRAGDWFMEFFENYDSYNTSLRVGTRWWQSVGDTTWSKCANVNCGGGGGLGLFNVGGLKVLGDMGAISSKLAWEGQKVLAHEIFVDYEIERFKFRGILGIKELSKGRGGNIRDWDWAVDSFHDYDLNDTDDWVTGTGNDLIFSDTESRLEDLDTDYIQLDFGYTYDLENFIPIKGLKITPFVGYYEYREKAVALGIYNHTNDVLKAAGASWVTPYDESLHNTRVLGNEIYWSGPRMGAEIEWQVNSSINLLANIAYAGGNVSDDDSHLLREDARGPSPNVFMRADAKGWMIDLLGHYKINLVKFNLPEHIIGVEFGYRYWRFDNNGDGVQFYRPEAGIGPFVTKEVNSARTGFILGLDYNF